MNVSATMINIRKAYHSLSGKNIEVSLTYKGTESGEIPWLARCDCYEAKSDSEVNAVMTLFSIIKEELKKKAETAERQAKQYRAALNSLAN